MVVGVTPASLTRKDGLNWENRGVEASFIPFQRIIFSVNNSTQPSPSFRHPSPAKNWCLTPGRGAHQLPEYLGVPEAMRGPVIPICSHPGGAPSGQDPRVLGGDARCRWGTSHRSRPAACCPGDVWSGGLGRNDQPVHGPGQRTTRGFRVIGYPFDGPFRRGVCCGGRAKECGFM